MNTTQNIFRDAVNASVRLLFEKASEEQSASEYATKVGLRMENVDVPEPQLSELSGPARASLTVEGSPYKTVQRFRGYPMTVTLRKYTADLEYTEEVLHWLSKQGSSKMKSEITRDTSDLVQSLYQPMNEDISKLFYLGFGTTFLTGGNSEALFASHTIRSTGATQKNTFASGSTHRPFGADALSDAIVILSRLKSHNDIELRTPRRVRVLCSKELAPDVHRTINSMYGPDNANLGVNKSAKEVLAMRGITIDHMVLADMPSAYQNYWFVMDLDRAARYAVYANAWMPRLTDENKNSTGSIKHLGSTYFGFGWSDATWAFGSKGDNSAI